MNINKSLLLLALLIICLNSCPDNCNDCDPSGSVCFACKHDYELSVLGKCIKNVIDKCIIYGPKNQCFVCQPSYQLNQGKCVKQYTGCINKNSIDNSCYQCAFGKYLKNGICTGSLNCEISQEYCSACDDGFELSNGQCIDRTLNCISLSQRGDGICQVCKTGYKLIGYKCVNQESIVPYCYVNYNEYLCERCKNGYSLFKNYCLLPSQIQAILNGSTTIQNTIAIIMTEFKQIIDQKKANSNVKPILQPQIKNTTSSNTIIIRQYDQIINCINQNNDVCLQCLKGYIPSKNLCIATDPNCGSYEFSTGKCTSCVYGYFLKQSNCIKPSSRCDGYDLINGNCLGCLNKLQLKDGKCVDINCQSLNGENCFNCNIGFKLNNITGICQFFDPNCAVSKQNYCEACSNGYYPNTQGTCWKLIQNCQFGNVQSEGSCIKCNQGFFIDLGNCKQIPEVKIQNCAKVQSGQCQYCSDGFVLKNNTCLKKSVLCTSYSNDGICLTCVNGCTLINGNCYDLNCLTQNQQKCIECKKNFKIIPPLFTCAFYDPNCQTNGEKQCSVCKNGYFKNSEGICEKNVQKVQPSLPSNTINVTKPNTQTNIDPNCIKYLNGKCEQCSNRYYFGSQGKCLSVNPSCKDYNSDGQCTSCYQGYIVIQGLCKTQFEADPKCRKRNAANQCIECYDGYFLNITKCQIVNPLCATTNMTTGQCLNCFSGFSLAGGSCIITVRDPYCQSYNSASGQCQKCSNRYYFNQNTLKCQPVSVLCRQYNDITGQCASCYGGYKINNGACGVSNDKNSDPNCANSSTDGSCLACFSGYYVKLGKCQKISPLCKGSNTKTGQCLDCYPGYVLLNSQCRIPDKQIQKDDPNCKQFADQTKKQYKKCYSGFFVKNGLCTQFNSLCQSSNLLNGDCQSCYQGYVLSAGQCVEFGKIIIVDNNDQYCLKINDNQCVECLKNYFLNSKGVCKQRNPQCKTINQLNGQCLTCYDGYILDSTNNCVQFKSVYIPFCSSVNATGNCIQCIDNYFVKQNQCKPVSILCGGSYNKQTGKCTGCLNGHFLQGGECIYPALGIDSSCDHYTNGFCDRCIKGFYLRNYFCAQINRNCIEFDYQRSGCTKCINNGIPVGPDCY